MTKSKFKFPGVDQDVMLALEIERNKKYDYSGLKWPTAGTLYAFANTPRAIARIKQAMGPESPPVLVQVVGDVALIFQTPIGAFWPMMVADVPFLPRHMGAIEHPMEAKPLVIYPDREPDTDPCATCPQDTRMLCQAYGGYLGLGVSIGGGDAPTLAARCEVSATAIAHANIHELQRTLSDQRQWQKPEKAEATLKIIDDNGMWRHAKGMLLSRDRLKEAGFWISDRVTVFRTDMGMKTPVNDYVADKLYALSRHEPFLNEKEPEAAKAIAESMSVHFDGKDIDYSHFKKDGRDTIDVDDLTFDSIHVTSAMVANAVARLSTQLAAKKTAAFKKENCARCVYKECRYTGIWGRPDEPCAITDQEIIDKYPNTDAARRWMALFKWSGDIIRVNGRERMVFGPLTTEHKDTPKWALRMRTPNYTFKGEAGPLQVVGEDWEAKIENEARRIGEVMAVDKQARLYFALRQLWNYCHWHNDRVRFNKDATGDKGRTSRNDVLYIELRGHDITIGSDTRASQRGGMYGYRGDSIKAHERPRFTTSYTHPYYDSIKDWTGVPLGTKKGNIHTRLRIVD